MALTQTEIQKRYAERHPERVAAYRASERYKQICREKSARYRAKHPEKVAAYTEKNKHKYGAEYRARNRERILATNRRWQKRNPDKELSKVRRYQAQKLNAVPAWADLEKIAEIYRASVAISKGTGIKHHVDHIVPLQSRIVCGLHVEHNLRVIRASENQRKRNFHWPDMPGRI